MQERKLKRLEFLKKYPQHLVSSFLVVMQNKVKGTLITFEGIDGSGKSTQIKLIKKYLYKNKKKALFTREPGGTLEAELIRKLILSKKKKINFEKKTEILLLLAARYEHYKKLIEPAISNGEIIICDRFIHSTLAYQCAGNNKLKKFYFEMSKPLINNFQPDLTILLDISPIKALERINKRKNNNRYDNKNLKFFSEVRKSYNELAKKNSKIEKLNAVINKNILAEKIQNLINNLLK